MLSYPFGGSSLPLSLPIVRLLNGKAATAALTPLFCPPLLLPLLNGERFGALPRVLLVVVGVVAERRPDDGGPVNNRDDDCVPQR
jgi:hypothetical protein